ncbi:MAG: hypothetical protein R3C14_12975 [Caldilineaceae bacterium]
MRRLLLFLLASVVAYSAARLVIAALPVGGYALRDGLALASLAIFSAAAASRSHVTARTAKLVTANLRTHQEPTSIGNTLLYTGLICAFTGRLLQGASLLLLPPLVGQVLFSMGLLLLLTAVGPWAWRITRFPMSSTTTAEPPSTDRPVNLGGNSSTVATSGSASGFLPHPEILSSHLLARCDTRVPDLRRNVTAYWLPLLFVMLVALGVRLLYLSQLPSVCVETECASAGALLAAPTQWRLFAGLTHLLFWWSADPVASLRWAGLILGVLIAPLFYLLLLRLLSLTGALLGATLLALYPNQVAMITLAPQLLETVLFLCGALWLLLVAYQTNEWRWWLVAGLLLSWSGQGSTGWHGVLVVWLLLLLLSAVISRHRDTLLGGLLTGAVLLSTSSLLFLPWSGAFAGPVGEATVAAPLAGLTLATLHPLWGMLLLVGLGVLLRNLVQLEWQWLGSALLVLGVAAYLPTALPYATLSSDIVLLLLLPLVTALALDQGLLALQITWRPLLAPAQSARIVLSLLLLMALLPLLALFQQTGALRTASQGDADLAMGRYLLEQLQQQPDLSIFAPTTVLNDPRVQLLATPTGSDQQLQPLEHLLNQLGNSMAYRDRLYLLKPNEPQWLPLLQELYPAGVVGQQMAPPNGPLLFTTFFVTAAQQAAQQGLRGYLQPYTTAAASPPAAGQAENGQPTFGQAEPTWAGAALTLTGPLRLDWPRLITANGAPVAPPFLTQWQGTLVVTAAGAYTFTVDGLTDPNEQLNLQLDNQLVLDSSLGLTSHTTQLAQGLYQLELYVAMTASASGQASAPLQVRWQRPDGRSEVIPPSALRTVDAPAGGLLGRYRAGDDPAHELSLRKDLLIGLPADLPTPYHTKWVGNVAAPRAGEYLFATLANDNSVIQLAVDGSLLADSEAQTQATDTGRSGYAEGVIYLTRGWHIITVDFTPLTKETTLQLFWQPPGSGPLPLLRDYLTPDQERLETYDRPLPLGPPTFDPEEQYSAFALSQQVDFWRPQVTILPTNLPLLPLEALWQRGSCGAGPEELDQPHGVAFSAARQTIAVADTANHRVVEYTLDGQTSRLYTNAGWQEPFDLDMADGVFPILLDAAAAQLWTLNPMTGGADPRPTTTDFYFPRGLALNNNGAPLIADTGGARVVALSLQGELLQSYGGPGTGIGKGQPVDTLVTEQAQWAVTAEDGRLWQLGSNGSIHAIAPTNTLHGPHLAGLPNGAFLLSDPARGLLLYHGADGQPLAYFADPIQLANPTGVAVLTTEEMVYIAVVDSAQCRVTLWRTSQELLPTS